jgi:hypothetical protein
MAEYIDRDAIYTAFANAGTDVLERASEIEYIAGFSYELVIEILDNIPAADVAPVVRCKDCKYYKPDEYESGCECDSGLVYVKANDDFCSYGERRTDK